MSHNKPIAVINNLNLWFADSDRSKQVLFNVNLELFNNEILAIVGESGSGKSVTTKILMGLLHNHNTTIQSDGLRVLDHDLLDFNDGDWSRFRGSVISMIFQEPMSSLNPTLTCGQQVAEMLTIHSKLTNKEIKNEVLQLLKKVKLPIPEQTYNKYPHQISGGQMQRVMIAMAIACKPAILIADEPTTALDVLVQNDIINLLSDLQSEYGMSVIFISHDLNLVRHIADRVAVMYQGKVVEVNTTQQLFNNAQHTYTQALIAARPDHNVRLKRLPTINDYMQGTIPDQQITSQQRSQAHSQLYNQSPILELVNINKQYALPKDLFKPQRYVTAVDDVSFKMFKGESLGLVGQSGCGKSTIGQLILGLHQPTSGKIVYKDRDITTLQPRARRSLSKEIQMIFQDPYASLNPRMTIGQAIIEPMQCHGIGTSNLDRKERVMQLLEQVGLTRDQFNRYPHEFSGGQRQRIGIARAVALRPQIIVCDESVSALDISIQAQVLNLLNDLKDEYDFTYLFISHDLSVVKYFCDKILVMNQGKIIEYNEADTLYENPQQSYTRQLIRSMPKG